MSEPRRPPGGPDAGRPQNRNDIRSTAPVRRRDANSVYQKLEQLERAGQLTAKTVANDIEFLLDVRSRLINAESSAKPMTESVATQVEDIEEILYDIVDRYAALANDPHTQTPQRIRSEPVLESRRDQLLDLNETQRHSPSTIMRVIGYEGVNDDLTAAPGFAERLRSNENEFNMAVALHPQGKELSNDGPDQEASATTEPHLKLVRRNDTPGRTL